ncbi:MAG TPA: ribbon-helix-helix domain-containing protein [Acidimicrobiales bacterium]|nr:ribbon-helix-helix domain-containing protein [Acidimicrobiales bacterium]
MKLSISVPDDDVAFVDDYAATHQASSRSAVIRQALTLLRASELEAAYASAFDDWSRDDTEVWETTTADGLI